MGLTAKIYYQIYEQHVDKSLVSRSNLNLPYFWSYVAQFSVEREMFQTRAVEKIKAHILYSINLFRKSFRLWENVDKYCRAGQATDDNVEHAHCMLDTWGYKDTLRICNTYCFPTAAVVARTRLNVPLHVQCLSCYFWVEKYFVPLFVLL